MPTPMASACAATASLGRVLERAHHLFEQQLGQPARELALLHDQQRHPRVRRARPQHHRRCDGSEAPPRLRVLRRAQVGRDLQPVVVPAGAAARERQRRALRPGLLQLTLQSGQGSTLPSGSSFSWRWRESRYLEVTHPMSHAALLAEPSALRSCQPPLSLSIIVIMISIKTLATSKSAAAWAPI